MTDANMQDTITEIGLQAEKARYLLDEILVGYYDCVEDPGYEQHRKLLVEFKRIWLKLSIIADMLVRIENATLAVIEE